MASKTIKVLLVDDHAIVRNGVRLMLSSASDIAVTAEATSAEEAINALNGQHFHVALVDIALPGKNGLDLLKSLRISHPALAVLILSAYDEEIYAVRARELGAAAYMSIDGPAAILAEAIRKASGHKT